jgi:hypothetical protein
MSTKSTLATAEVVEKTNLHIYEDTMDGTFWIEVDEARQGRVKLPKEIAIKFSEILKNVKA